MIENKQTGTPLARGGRKATRKWDMIKRRIFSYEGMTDKKLIESETRQARENGHPVSSVPFILNQLYLCAQALPAPRLAALIGPQFKASARQQRTAMSGSQYSHKACLCGMTI